MTPFLHKYHKHLIITLLVIIAIEVGLVGGIVYKGFDRLFNAAWDASSLFVGDEK